MKLRSSLTFVTLASASIKMSLLHADSSESRENLPSAQLQEYKKQDALVKELKARLEAESNKRDLMKSAFTDCANSDLPSAPNGLPIVEEVDGKLFKKRNDDFHDYEREQKLEKIKTAIKNREYFPFIIRKTVTGSKESLDPASISYLKNNNGNDSYSIDAGIQWEPLMLRVDAPEALHWGALDSIQFSPFAEYHRNTAASALTDTLTLGANARLTLDKKDALADFFQYIDVGGGWKNADLAEGKSVFAHLQYTPLMRCYRLGLFGSKRNLTAVPSSEWAQLRIVPTVGLSYQHVYDGIKSGFEGDNLILKANVEAEYFPKAWIFEGLQDKLVLRTGYSFWSYISHTKAFSAPDRNLGCFHLNADFYIDGKRPGPSDPKTGKDGHFAIGLEYTKGDNPDTGAFDTDQVLLTFRVLF